MKKSNTAQVSTITPHRAEAGVHRYAIGQAVRLIAGVPPKGRECPVYRVTGTLPSRGDHPQYRIRSDSEPYERVVAQDDINAWTPPARNDGSDDLIERTFSHG